MGAQVYNQMIQRVHQSPAPPRLKTSMRPALERVNRVKCNLFGKVESASLKQYVEQHIQEHNEAKSKKWGFDFQSERPLENGKFEWQLVQTKPATPTMITLTHAAHVIPSVRRLQPLRRSHSSTSSSMEDLMDERANRANAAAGEAEETLDDSLTSSTSTLSPAAPATSRTSEDSESETIDTYPTLHNCDRIIRKLRRESPQRAARASPPRLRQPQITEYMKERKRLVVAPVERITAKKVRLMDGGASTSSSSNATEAVSTPNTSA